MKTFDEWYSQIHGEVKTRHSYNYAKLAWFEQQKEVDHLKKQNEVLRECVGEYEKLDGFPRNPLCKLYAVDLSLWDIVKNKVYHLKEKLS